MSDSVLHWEQDARDGAHVPVRWTYTNITDRDAGDALLAYPGWTGSYEAKDEGGVAQVGAAAPFAYYMLTDATGPTWTAALGAPGAAVWTIATETTAARTAAAGEFILIAAATCVITLPAPVAGDRVACKVITSTITSIEIRTSGSGVDIDGADYSSTGLSLTTQYEQISLISDGTDWFIY